MIISSKIKEIAGNERHGLLLIFIIWIIIQAIAFLKFGISTPIDTGLYLGNANGILTGDWPSGREFFYTSYSSLLAVLLLFNVKVEAIIIFQIVIGAMAVFAVYKITQIITRGNFIAFLAAMLYAGWFEFQEWNLIVYTDSLFANGVVIAVYLLMIARNPWQQFMVLLLIGFVALLRPPGVGFVVALGCSFIIGGRIFSNGSVLLKTVLIASVLLVGGIAVNAVLAEFVDSFLDSYAKAEIIYPDISLGIASPDRLVVPDENQIPIVRLTLFAVFNPVYFLKISVLKAVLFLGHAKPYYSLLHNLNIGLYLGVSYFFALWGTRRFPDRRLGIFIVLFIGFQVVTVALTSENWDGRFLLPVLPWVFIAAAVGVSGLRDRVFGTNN